MSTQHGGDVRHLHPLAAQAAHGGPKQAHLQQQQRATVSACLYFSSSRWLLKGVIVHTLSARKP